jgi:hypothetical protein
MDIIQILKQDYQKFPNDQTYSIYAEDVFFKDPLNRFRGLNRYKQMIALIKTLLKPKMELHDIRQVEDKIETRWTLRWNAPLPWKPAIAIPGRSELQLNTSGLVVSHIDYWNCSRLDVLKQHLLPTRTS